MKLKMLLACLNYPDMLPSHQPEQVLDYKVEIASIDGNWEVLSVYCDDGTVYIDIGSKRKRK